MSDATERLEQLRSQVNDALAAARSEGGSAVLIAVVEEFGRKVDKALGAGEDGIYEAIVEAEQAADSAKYAAEADAGLTADARQVIVGAHDRICVMKTKMRG